MNMNASIQGEHVMRSLKTAAILTLAATGPVSAEDMTLKMATIAPSLGQAITMATFANIVTDNLEGVAIEVSGGGAATLHQVEVGRGNLDLSMTSPVIYNLMTAGKAMYKNESEAPDLAKNVDLLMWFPYGAYHFAVRAESDIELLDDIEGASVFLGPQGGGAYNAARGWVEATTGLVAGEDYDAITGQFGKPAIRHSSMVRLMSMSMVASILAASSSSLPKPRSCASSDRRAMRARPWMLGWASGATAPRWMMVCMTAR